MFEKLFLCGDYPQKLQHASCTSVLTSLIQTCFWSIINSLVIVNRWSEVLVTASNKCRGIKSVLHFNGTPHLPFHSMSPRIIISLISQGLFKWCVSYRSAVSMSSIKSGTSCIGKWNWKDESYLLAFVCHSSVQRWQTGFCAPLLSLQHTSQEEQADRLALLLHQWDRRHKQREQNARAPFLPVELPGPHKCPHFSGRMRMHFCSIYFLFPRLANLLMYNRSKW